MSVNLDGQFLLSKAFVPGMQQRCWGRVINVWSSTVGLAIERFVHYMASKMRVIGLVDERANGRCRRRPHGRVTFNDSTA